MQESISVYQQAILLSKSVIINGQKEEVYGLKSLRVKPRGKGMGREILKGLESVARLDGKFCIVAFCGDEIIDFYRSCGWSSNGLYEDKYHILTSISVESIIVEERW